jgi:TolB-like protein/Flp pilus assembly protein TadD
MAVLPFRFAGPAEEALLGDGIADEVREALRGVEGLAVVSRIESEGVGSGAEARAALVRLGVEIVVSGEIERIGLRLRVAVRLTTVADGRELWRDTYERDARDLFALTRRLVQAIVGSLRITLADEAAQRVARAPTADLEAYRLYLQGRRHWTKRREALQGLEYLQLAVGRDPSFALAHAGIADAYNTLGSWETAELPSWEAFPRAQAAAIKALELDPTLAEGRAALAYAQTHYLWQWERAEQGLRDAIALRPSYSHAHHWHSHLLCALGRFDESLAASRRAFELDPLDPVMNAHIAWHHWCAGEWNLAVDAAGRSQINFPGEHWPPFFLGLALAQRGETEPAVEALRRALALSRESCVMLGGLGWGLAMAGDRQAAHRIARTLHGVAETRHVAAYETALIHAALDEPDLAFDWLDRAYEERSASLTYLRVDPRLDPLRGDPRFSVLATAVGHPPLIQRGVSSG